MNDAKNRAEKYGVGSYEYNMILMQGFSKLYYYKLLDSKKNKNGADVIYYKKRMKQIKDSKKSLLFLRDMTNHR